MAIRAHLRFMVRILPLVLYGLRGLRSVPLFFLFLFFLPLLLFFFNFRFSNLAEKVQ